jgi:hypothetical protein
MPVILLMAILLCLGGCNGSTWGTGQSKQSEIEARQKAEAVARQKVEQAARESNERRDRLHTLRIVAFVVLAGGAVAVIAWASQPAPRPVFDSLPVRPLPEQRPVSQPLLLNDSTRPRGEGRVIDLPRPGGSSGSPRTSTPPSAPMPQQRKRRRNHRPDNRRDNPRQNPQAPENHRP